MPVLRIDTNVQKEKIPEEFFKEITNIVADLLNKPVQYVVVHVNPDRMMTWAGTKDPCANITLASIGGINLEQNKTMSKTLSDFIQEKLGIVNTRMYINFIDMKRENVGYAGKTFAG